MSLTLGILFTSYGPYHLARVQGLIESPQFAQHKIYGIELARAQEDYPWQIDTHALGFPLVSVIEDGLLEQVPPLRLLQKLNQTLNAINPDVLAISGYARPAMLWALAWCRLHRKPAILFSETTEADFTRSPWKEQIKRTLIAQYQAALVGGQPQKRYLMKLGVAEKTIALGYNVVGNHNFHPSQIRTLPRPIQNPYFLTVNRFVTKKNLPFVLNAYARYRQAVGESAWDLVLCGDGILRPQLEQQIQRLGLTSYVHLPGFLQQNKLLPYFAHAHCFIHASTHEQWGLVVNEAMAAGLPVLVSNRCGCAEDLVIEGVNGFSFDPENTSALAQLMEKISSGAMDLAPMGQAALEHIQKFSPAYFAEGLFQAIQSAVSPIDR